MASRIARIYQIIIAAICIIEPVGNYEINDIILRYHLTLPPLSKLLI
jgi:hypothetical protein